MLMHMTANIRALKSVSEAGAELLGRREMRMLRARLQAEHDALYPSQREEYLSSLEAIRESYEGYGPRVFQSVGVAAGAR